MTGSPPRVRGKAHNSSTEGVLELVWHFAAVASLVLKFGASRWLQCRNVDSDEGGNFIICDGASIFDD